MMLDVLELIDKDLDDYLAIPEKERPDLQVFADARAGGATGEGLMHGILDLGNGHTFEFTRRQKDGVISGGIHHHPRPDNGEPCAGAVTFLPYREVGHPAWDVESADPLTLSPSLLCRSCGSHGFIRNGRWVNA